MGNRKPATPWLTLLLLTLLGGALRFTAIDRPAIWGDEAASWRRISGSWQQLTDELRQAGFQPAHYVLTWWIKEGLPLAGDRRLHEWWTRPDGSRYWGEASAGARPDPRRPQPARAAAADDDRRRARDPEPGEARLEFVPSNRLLDARVDPSPLVMRFIPALCGTLMVPAMYFLASQLVARRTALLVALFTCFSAYQLGYSRDAKMYAQLWFFATLHVGCLLWWLKAYRPPDRDVPPPPPEFPKQAELGEGVAGVLPGRHVGQIARAFVDNSHLDRRPRAQTVRWPTRLDVTLRWACWVTTGLAMIAFHAVGLGILGIELLIFLATLPLRTASMRRTLVAIASPALLVVDLVAARRRRREAIVATPSTPEPATSGPEQLPQPATQAYADEEDDEVAVPYAVAIPDDRSPRGDVAARGELSLRDVLSPDDDRDDDLPAIREPARPRAATVRARPAPAVEHDERPSPFRVFVDRLRGFTVPPIVGFLIGVAAVGSLWWSYREFTRFYDRVADTESAVKFDVNDAGIVWVEPYNEGRTGASLALENATAYLLSWEWPKPDWQPNDEGKPKAQGVPAANPRAFRYLSLTATVLLAAAAVGLVPWRFAFGRLLRRRPKAPRKRLRDRLRGDAGAPTLESISRPTPPPLDDAARRDRGPMPLVALLIVAAWLFVPAYAFYTASGAWKENGARTRAVSPTQAIVNLVYPQAYNDEAKLLAGGASLDVANWKAAEEPWPQLRERLLRRNWGELFVVRGIDWRQPRWPWLWPLIGVGLVVMLFSRRATWGERLRWTLGGALVLAVLYLLLIVTYAATPVQPRSVWMPRYLGFVWPAFAIAVCTLLMRLPVAPLRWAVVALLLVANGTVFAARVQVGEPPVFDQAADYARATREPATRLFVLQQVGRLQFGGPGTGTLFSLPGGYYASRMTGESLSPREALLFAQGRIPEFATRVRDAAQVGARLRRDTTSTTLIVWAEVPPDTAEGAIAKQLADALGPTWRPTGEPTPRTVCYDHWTWRRLYAMERHAFARTAADAAAAARPAPRPPTPATRPAPPRSPVGAAVPSTRSALPTTRAATSSTRAAAAAAAPTSRAAASTTRPTPATRSVVTPSTRAIAPTTRSVPPVARPATTLPTTAPVR